MKTTVTILVVFAFTICAFSQSPEDWQGKVMTVNGLIPADSMGITLPHEHLLIVHKYNYLDLTNETEAITELGYYANAGGKTLFEASAIGIGRNPEGLKRISTATGVNVVMCAGYYKNQWIHDSIKNKSVGQLTEIIINDIINGINGIHAGFIKIAMSRPITPFEEKVLIAAALAQKATGVAIEVHFDGDLATNVQKHHVLDVFENEGVDLSRVCLSHAVPYTDLVDDFITLAQRGCYLAFDMQGLEVRVAFQHERELAETLNALIGEGYLEQILISQDVCFSVCYVKNGGYGYAHILNTILPQLKTSGITDEQIYTMMVENPKRLFPFKNHIDVDECADETFTAMTGIITDNSGPSDYYDNKICRKLIQPSGAVKVTLTFNSFATESGFDFMKVYDGATTSAPLLGRFSGTSLPAAVSSTGGSMLIVFTTDYDVGAAGWSVTYTGIAPVLSVTPESGSISAASGTTTFTVASNIDWSVSESSNWLTATMINDTMLTVIYDENTIVDSRSAEITVSGAGVTSRNIIINQSGANPILIVSPESGSISSASGTITFTVASNIDWSVSESSNLLTATKTDATMLTVSYAENTSVDSRSLEITVSGAGVSSQNITVNQSGASPVLNVLPISRSMSAAPGITTFTITSNIDWSISESSDWVSALKTDAATLVVSYDKNTSEGSRVSEITVIGASVDSKSVYIIQEGAIPTNIKQPSEIPRINVFPNPVSDKTWLTYSKGTAEFIEIYEPSGRLIIRLQDSDENGVTEIDFSGLNSGLYIYRLIDTEGNIYNGKIFKE